MSCVENPEPEKLDSEMEEGEIVDDLDDISDVSSEEEYMLLRKRLRVLEKYNNVLERTKAKRSSLDSGIHYKKPHSRLQILSAISAKELEDTCITIKNDKHIKTHYKPKRKKELETNNNIGKHKDKRIRKNRIKSRKKLDVRVKSSEESEDEYKNKRRELANAVNFNNQTSDKSSLSARLKKMLAKADDHDLTKCINSNDKIEDKLEENVPPRSDNPFITTALHDQITESIMENSSKSIDLIDISTDDEIEIIEAAGGKDTVDPNVKETNNATNKKDCNTDSDEDLELLRQHALKTKVDKKKCEVQLPNIQDNKVISEDEDSDTAELRLICLKSALLKKAIERKQKQKLKKRLSQSSNLNDDFLNEKNMLLDKFDLDNNTDMESVDMEIVSDCDEKGKDIQFRAKDDSNQEASAIDHENDSKDGFISHMPIEDDFDEDEDLLRAKLLTSLTKNLSKLITPIINTTEEVKDSTDAQPVAEATVPKANVAPQQRFIIKVGESDSEGEHEATKNLTKMHMKLSNQNDFQQRLDIFLKSTRMEVEETKSSDVVQEKSPPKKFVAKAVNHLPKSEQIEYKNLVKRMAELEKIKQARQASIYIGNKAASIKDMLKPRNTAVESKMNTINYIENQIALSRKKIAEESAKMLRLKEEGTKLSQRYKIVATELWNITTAITLNKKQQRALQNSLTKIRLHHQSLLKRSTLNINKKINMNLQPINNRINKIPTNRLQKENNPTKVDHTNLNISNNVRVNIVTEPQNDPSINSRLSVQEDVGNNKKVIQMANNYVNNDIRNGNVCTETLKNIASMDESGIYIGSKHPVIDNENGYQPANKVLKFVNDYTSPLGVFGNTNWQADPNAILCPFDVTGHCKDPDCKYFHSKSTKKQ